MSEFETRCLRRLAKMHWLMAYWRSDRRGEVAEPGLRRTPGERVDSKGSRGFKSPPLRQHYGGGCRFEERNILSWLSIAWTQLEADY